MTKIIHPELNYAVRGVLLDVFNALGPMLKEEFYRDAIVHGLTKRGIRCDPEKSFEVFYRGIRVGLYFVDIWIENGKIFLEIKVAPIISRLHKAQGISYLKVTDADLAIVVSFGAESLIDQRLPNFVRGKVVEFQPTPHALADDLLYPELSVRLFDALHRVHFELGPGFLHQIYRRATMIELQFQGIPFEYIKQIPISYDGQTLGYQDVRLLRVANQILLATIAVQTVDQPMQEQLKARLRHLDLQLGFIANFHGTSLDIVPVRR